MKQKEIMVLGAGMVGVSTALALQARGHHVILLDRQQPGRDGASFGNAGLIQREAVEPYGFPRDLATLVGAALGRENAIHYHLSALPALASPLFQYWRNSAPARYPQIAAEYAALIAHSTSEHAPWIEAAGAGHLIRKQGWHEVYRSAAAFDKGARDAERIRAAWGLAGRALSGQELAALEPALKKPLAGSILWQDPWSVASPGDLVDLYAKLFVQRGGEFRTGQGIELSPRGAGWCARGAGLEVSAQEAVMALGAWSFDAVRKLGYALPVFVKRGYHRHFRKPQNFGISMLDAENGIMLAPMTAGLRICTGAEFARLDAPATPVQIQRSTELASELVQLGEPVEDMPWLGARPCVADMKPLIGPAVRHKGLWFNFGHGHQGLTLGPASARLLAEQIDGEPTFVPAQAYLPARFEGR
ncbi:NAD(P)/FAD-dependent oxidoreductase [Comamonas composti]|uniref:NAD(P)/FAD-dependent oxidoreductase n=1 Tax=Comamonas composti TaxID=408558 RepID=UPI000427F1DC|nr:FAD-dependent oxidoreductase [Comamonas composti]